MKKLVSIATGIILSALVSATVSAEIITEEKIFDLSSIFNNHIYDYNTSWSPNTLGNSYEHDRGANSYWGKNRLWAWSGSDEKKFASIVDENYEKANDEVRFRFSPVTNNDVGRPENKDTLMIPKEGYTIDLEATGNSSNYESIYFAATARAKDDTEKTAIAQSGIDNYEIIVAYADDTTEELTLKIHGGLNENADTLFIKAYASMLYGNSNPSPLCIHYYKIECDSTKIVKSVTFKAPENCTTEGKIIVWAMTGYESVAEKIAMDIEALGDDATLEQLRTVLEKIEAYKEKGGLETDISNYDKFQSLLGQYVTVKDTKVVNTLRGAKITVEFSGLIEHDSFKGEILKENEALTDYFTYSLTDDEDNTTAVIDVEYIIDYDAVYKLSLSNEIRRGSGKEMVGKYDFEYQPQEFLVVKEKSAQKEGNIITYNVKFDKQYDVEDTVNYFFTIGIYSDKNELMAVDYKVGTVETLTNMEGTIAVPEGKTGKLKCYMLNSKDLKSLIKGFEITMEW